LQEAAIAAQTRVGHPHAPADGRARDLALFNLAIDSKLRGCDVVKLTVADVALWGTMKERATTRQQTTGRPLQFELTEQTRQAVEAWIKRSGKCGHYFLFTGRGSAVAALATRQYARVVDGWLASIGSRSLRHTFAAERQGCLDLPQHGQAYGHGFTRCSHAQAGFTNTSSGTASMVSTHHHPNH
jgi:integrase